MISEKAVEAAARKLAGQYMVDDGYAETSRASAESGEMWRNFRKAATVALEAALPLHDGREAERAALAFGFWSMAGPSNEAEAAETEKLEQETWAEYLSKHPAPVECKQEASAWQPIETAPKDGTPIEVKGGLGPYSVTSWTGQAAWGVPTNWLKTDATWRTPIKGAVLSLAGYHPTHWRPLIAEERGS